MFRKTLIILAMIFAMMGPRSVAWGQNDNLLCGGSFIGSFPNDESWIGSDVDYYSGNGYKFDTNETLQSPDLPSGVKKVTIKILVGHNGGATSTLVAGIYDDNDEQLAVSDNIVPTVAYNAQTDDAIQEFTLDGGTTDIKYVKLTFTKVKNYGMKKLEVYDATSTPTKTLISVAISGKPSKTEYEAGESFDPAGLVVTGTYNDDSQETITSGITWNVTPNPLTAGTTSVSVTATVDGKSDTKNYDVTVNAIEGDRLTLASTGVSGSSYAEWSGKTGSEGVAVYAGKSAGSNNAIQLNNTNPNGIVSTTSAGLIKKVKVDWESHTSDGRYITIYGSNTAYTSSANVYDTEKQGTSLGTIKKGTNTELTITGDYAYVGVKANGALYMNSITFIWSAPKELVSIAVKTAPTTVNYAAGEFFNPAGLEITATYDDASTEDITYEGNEDKFSFSPALDVALATTDEKVTITYGGKSCDQTITVKNIELTSIVVSGDLAVTEYTEGDDFDFTGLVATGYYSDETNKVITDQVEWSIDPATLTAGQTSVKVIATMNEISGDKTYDITVAAAPLEVTWDATAQGYENSQAVTEADFNAIINAEFEEGKYYTSGTAVRVYGGKTFAIHATSGYKITSIVIGFGEGDNSNTITADCGTYSSGTWTGSAKDVTFTVGGTSGHRRLKTFTVTYAVAAPAVATPTITPSAETCWEPITVTLATETEGATIYYTTDGTTPTTASDLYENPIEVSKTTTIKAIAVKDGFDDSEIASATYTFPITLAAVRQQASGNVFTKGVVSWASDDKKNAYIQDATGGLYVYSSSASNNLIADNEIALKGSLTSYYGLLEIKPTEIIKISGDNTVTAVVKTIYEINADAEDKNALQGVKVTVEKAEVTTGATTSGTAVIKQGENSLNFYHPSVDLAVGDVVTITAIVGNYNGVQLVNDFGITFVPVIDVEEEFTTFSYTVGNGPSDAQEFLFEGKNLKDNVTITASDNFEICKTIDGEYNSSLIITAENGIVNGNAYIRLKAGLDADNYEGTLTFSTTGLENIVINLAGQVTQNQTFSITIDENIENGSVVAKISDIEVDIAEAGAEVTLIATPDEHYQFVEWTVMGKEEITVTNDKFTMPACDVLVSATFSQKTVNITYSVNGDVAALVPATVGEGDEITLPTPGDEYIPTGFDFAGWSSSESSTTTIDKTYIVNADVTLYAVFSRVEGGTQGSGNYEKVTENLEDWSGTYLLVYEGDEKSLAWTGVDEGQCHTDVTIEDNVISSKPENAVVLSIAPMTDGYSIKVIGGINNGKYIGKSANANGMDFKEDAQLNTLAYKNNDVTITAEGGCTLRYNSSSGASNERFRYYKSGQQPIQLYKKDEGTPGVTKYYTRVFTEESEIDNLTVEAPMIIMGGSTLTVTNDLEIANNAAFTIEENAKVVVNGTLTNLNAANLIIKDGGQLIFNNAGSSKDNNINSDVKATVEKNIIPYSSNKDGGVKGWHFLAAPMKDFAVESFINQANGKYDLYKWYIKEDGTPIWYNYKAHDSNHDNGFETYFVSGRGYLAAYATTDLLKMQGTLNAGTTFSFTEELNSKGNFTLLGNPFTYYLKWSDFTMENVYDKGFAVVDSENGIIEYVAGDDVNTIKVGTGFMVYTEDDGAELSFTKDSGSGKSNDILALNLFASNGNGEDNTIIVIDDNNGGFAKADNFNTNVPQIYTEKLQTKYGIRNFSTNTKEFFVSFKAVGEGSNTIRLETIGEFDYVHLYDKLLDVDVDMLLEGSYTFEASEGDDTHRFIVRIDKGNTGIDENETENFVNVYNGEIHVSGSGEVQIFDVMGRIVHSEVISGDATISTGGFKGGVYVVRLIGNGWTKTEKIVVRR